jgi:glycosyltransferase involved in cell wall biosynthesis
MRVLLLNYEFPPAGGGAGFATSRIAASLVEKGIQAEILTSRINREDDGGLVQGVPVHRVSSWRVDIHDCGLRGAYTYVLAAALKRRKLHARRHYDLEHYFFSLPTGLLSLLPIGEHVPYIVSLRGSDVPGYDPFNAKLEKLHSLMKPVTRRIWRHASKVVALSDALAETARKTAPDVDIEVISNGIDSEQFFPPEARTPESPVRLITVARLLKRKGIHNILEACAIPSRLPVQLQIIGTGPFEARLREMVDELNLSDCVQFLGFVPNEELPAYYRNADIFVLPSAIESFGLVFAEAMSCGLPIVATRVGGIPETVRDGIDGLLCAPDDPMALRENIVRLMSDFEIRKDMSKSQRRRVLKHYLWRHIAERYADLYRSALDSSGRRPVSKAGYAGRRPPRRSNRPAIGEQ